ncbi:glucose 1-dehydrogenase [Kitasatospora sp. MAP5-34]|uniref:SDR family NAD(P)-dependent oxidoreductase n=1 Tax=Kitasatospora sp. MAP5-34 TaxID=3035102 RepID=UPI0024763669|nr:glucose 1-dehydrogenase [Kitasatospora sp. MAP5-34]MDH6576301.1 NAD(P)-dependent dehydrogenase (short-subunit alcohol dehydrogenase family) [Kitasatospora sp. MAP5-34]
MTQQQTGLLSGKVALITGASSGIGAAAARVFAREGASVVLFARREKELASIVDELKGDGHKAAYVVGDVVQPDDVARAVRFAVEQFGALHAAFNNAGYGVGRTPLHLMDDSVYDQIMDTNVRGVWNCLRQEITVMLEHGGGSIVNTSSVGGLVATPVAAPYVTSKHAVIGLTKAAAAEYGSQGIRVNAVAPGTTRSEMVAQWFDQNPGVEEMLHQLTPQPRTAEPEEIAEAAAWLCSDRASFVTGAVLPVDGGFTIL